MHKVRDLGGLIGLVGVMLAGQEAMAQDAPAPQPGAQSAPPPVVVPRTQPQTLPGVLPERFSIGPTPTPTPAAPPTEATPTPSPVPVPSPVSTATPASRPPAGRAPQPRAIETPVGQPTALPVPEAAPPPAPASPSVVTPNAAPVAEPMPQAAAPGSDASWLPYVAGALALVLAGGAGWRLLRRRRPEEEIAEDEAVEVPEQRTVAPPPGLSAKPAVAPLPTQPRPVPAPAAAPTMPVPAEPFEIALRPTALEMRDEGLVLDFELLIGNVQASAAENIRVTVGMMSANPEQDRTIAGFHANPMVEPAAAPFDLAPGAGGRMQLRLALPRGNFHVVDLGGRPITVPLVMVSLRWRSGISIRRFGANFMVGAAGQGGKIGPIRVDRNGPGGALAANRYMVRELTSA